MSSSECVSCKSLKAPLICGVCANHVCKACAHFAGEESVALLESIPAHYSVGAFCQECFDLKIAPEIESYEEILERAKKIDVFYKSQSKESRFIRRTEKPIRVTACDDKDAAVMKLAFLAAKRGFNILVDVETEFTKVHPGGNYKTSICGAVAIPAVIDPEKLKRRFIGSPN
jgi:hypothetical protein